jgi:hypothetical protein
LLILSARSERFKVQQWERASNDWSDSERKNERSDSDCTTECESDNKYRHFNDGASATYFDAALSKTGKQSVAWPRPEPSADVHA